MDKTTLRSLLVEHLGDLAEQPGGAVGSSLVTLRPGRFYLMGYNPGGDREVARTSIADNLSTPAPGWSVYTHDCWKCDERPRCEHLDDDGSVVPSHRLRHQNNALTAFEALGVSAGEVFSTNAVFARSKRAATLAGETSHGEAVWWAQCWGVHQAFLRIVRPRWIVTFGKGHGRSAFGLLMRHAGVSAPHPAGGDKAKDGRWFDAHLDVGGAAPLRVGVLGLPHPSYHALSDSLAAFVRERVAA